MAAEKKYHGESLHIYVFIYIYIYITQNNHKVKFMLPLPLHRNIKYFLFSTELLRQESKNGIVNILKYLNLFFFFSSQREMLLFLLHVR